MAELRQVFKKDDVVRRCSDGQKMFVHQVGRWSNGEYWIECVCYSDVNEHRAKYAALAIEPWSNSQGQ